MPSPSPFPPFLSSTPLPILTPDTPGAITYTLLLLTPIITPHTPINVCIPPANPLCSPLWAGAVTLGVSVGYAEDAGSRRHAEQQFKWYGEGLPSPTAESVQFGAMPRPPPVHVEDRDNNNLLEANPFGIPQYVRSQNAWNTGGEGGGGATAASGAYPCSPSATPPAGLAATHGQHLFSSARSLHKRGGSPTAACPAPVSLWQPAAHVPPMFQPRRADPLRCNNAAPIFGLLYAMKVNRQPTQPASQSC